MYRSLVTRRGRGFWASRAAAMGAIALLHAGVIAFALVQRAARPLPEPTIVAIGLTSPQARAPALTAPPTAMPRFEIPTQAVLLPPQFPTDIADPVPESAVTAAFQPVATDPPQAVATYVAPLQISQAEYLRPPVLRYPPAALAARREGTVGLRVLVSEGGRVLEVMVERPSGFAPFDEAACSAVRGALFKPYTVNGEPRTVLVHIPIDFTLKRRG